MARRPSRDSRRAKPEIMTLENEPDRIRSAYAARNAAGKRALYAWHHADVQLYTYGLRAATAEILKRDKLAELSDLDILDVGCGAGSWLLTCLQWGAGAERLHGIDLLEDRIAWARGLLPQADLRVVEGATIPYPDASMDLIFAQTVFSSIKDPVARMALAGEMCRVTKPKGAILIYDFRISHPRSPDTVGIRLSEIQRLFPAMVIARRRLTLAPPIARRVAPWSPLLVHALEACLPFLRTHALYLVRGSSQERPG